MTNEEIIKALQEADDLAIYGDVDCGDVLAYINHLKYEIKSLKEDNERYIERLEISPYGDDKIDELEQALSFARRTKEEVRKETIRKILRELLDYCKGQGDVCYDIDIKELAEKYGVEVEE